MAKETKKPRAHKGRKKAAKATAKAKAPVPERPCPIETEARLRAIVDTAVDAIITIDEFGIVDAFNPAAEKMFGFKAKEVLGEHLTLLMPEPFSKHHDEYVHRYMETGENHVIGRRVEVVGRRKNGTVFPMELSVSEMLVNGRRMFTGIGRDVTEKREASERIRQTSRFLESILDSLSNHIAILDSEGIIIHVNDAWRRYTRENNLGIPEDGIGVNYLKVCLESMGEEGRRAADGIRAIMRGDTPDFSMEYLCPKAKSEQWFKMQVTCFRGHDGQRVVVSHENITARKAAERDLQEERNFVSTVLDTAGALLVVTDIRGRIVRFNRACEALTGYSSEEVLGRTIWDFLVDEDDVREVRRVFSQLRRTVFTNEAENHWMCRDGTKRLIAWRNACLLNEEGKRAFIVSSGIDISERERIARELREIQKLEAVGRVVGGLAHDFNTIVGVITGHCEYLLYRQLHEDDPLRGDIDEILRAGQRATDLIQQVLAFSRRQSSRPKRMALNEVVSDIEQMLRRLVGREHELTIKTQRKLGEIRGDRGQMEQVILNLVVNARDALERSGSIAIEVENEELSENYARQRIGIKPGQFVHLAVRDTGHGIDTETMPRIFEPFFTTKEPGKGTGLGLSTVYGIVRQHGGTIEVDSTPGEGTAFHIYLPCV